MEHEEVPAASAPPKVQTAPRRDLNPFDVWAPHQLGVRIQIGKDQPIFADLERKDGGWWGLPGGIADRVLALGDEAGLDYGYLITPEPELKPDGTYEAPNEIGPVADPRSRFQPHGVNGLSRFFDPGAHQWGDDGWRAPQLQETVLYEMHVGTFTEEGTLDSAIERLPHLKALGITTVELMPVNQFNGEYGWGYDGTGWFSVHDAYGGPAAYQRFVDAAHQHGLAVAQDVVHNHFGPEGNPTWAYSIRPSHRADRQTVGYQDHSRQSSWGSVTNIDLEPTGEVRRAILDSVEMWIRDYHVDMLRLDAIHALVDTDPHILTEISELVDDLSAELGRPVTVVAESDLNDPRLITPREKGGQGMHGQWSDDFHHSLHANMTMDVSGYFADFEGLESLKKTLEQGFFHDGNLSSFREKVHGKPIDRENTSAKVLVVASDNHDQVGNRAGGSRNPADLTLRQHQVRAALTVLNANTPMLFAGQEFAASTPFAYFSNHGGQLGRDVSAGRKAEFARMGWDESEIPDPELRSTYLASKLNWKELSEGDHAIMLQTYKDLLELRSAVPDLTSSGFDSVKVDFFEQPVPAEQYEAKLAADREAHFERLRAELPHKSTDVVRAMAEALVEAEQKSTSADRIDPSKRWVVMHRGDDTSVVVNLGTDDLQWDAADVLYSTGDVQASANAETGTQSVTLGSFSVAVIKRAPTAEVKQAGGDPSAVGQQRSAMDALQGIEKPGGRGHLMAGSSGSGAVRLGGSSRNEQTGQGM